MIRLCAVLLVRIYKSDKAQWSTYELDQWVAYMRYAGVNKFFVYDTYHYIDESLAAWSSNKSRILYHDWSAYANPYGLQKTQGSAYQNAIDVYADKCEWMIQMDMDEYPFSLVDKNPRFLQRLIQTLGPPSSDISELSLANFVFEGAPTTGPGLVIERITRRSAGRTNRLDKPICRPKNVRAGVHHNRLIRGKHLDVDPDVLRINHYWGQRRENWGNCVQGQTGCMTHEKILANTVEDYGMLYISKRIKHVFN